MSLPADIKYKINDAIDSALADFNDAYRGVIEETHMRGDYGKVEEYHIITNDDENMQRPIEDYLDEICNKMQNALHVYLKYPFTPYVEWDGKSCGDYCITIGYVIVSDIQFLRKLADCGVD
jgi:predicted RNA-binding protein Jag